MSAPGERAPQRDTDASPFCGILARLTEVCPRFEAAVFFDEDGETIDYHSFCDPFQAKLAGALHGVLASSAARRMTWLEMGEVEWLEVRAQRLDSVTVPLGEGLFVTLVAGAGAITPAVRERLGEVIGLLREESGL